MREDIWQRRDREAREWAQLAIDTERRALERARSVARGLLLAVAVFGGMLLYAHCAKAQEFDCPPPTEEHVAPRRATSIRFFLPA